MSPARKASTSAPTISTRALNRALLARQLLLARQSLPATDAVSRVGGLQAQLARPPFVGLWTRLRAFERAQLLAPVRGREIVRATAMRGTIHLMTAADYCAHRGALQPTFDRGLRSVGKSWVDTTDLAALDAQARAYFGGAPATFEALRDHLAATDDRGNIRLCGYAVRMRLPLVQVPTDAPWGWPAAAEFALAEAWFGHPVRLESGDARALVRHYLAAFGPATPADAQAWSGIAGLRATFDTLRDELMSFRDERGRELFDLPDAPRPDADAEAPVRLLPEFDTAILGHADRSRIVPDAYRSRLVTKNLFVPATILVDGFVVGSWTAASTRKTATLTITPFAKVAKRTRTELEAEAEALLAFTEPEAGKAEVRWG
jgi:hypothetical protein